MPSAARRLIKGEEAAAKSDGMPDQGVGSESEVGRDGGSGVGKRVRGEPGWWIKGWEAAAKSDGKEDQGVGSGCEVDRDGGAAGSKQSSSGLVHPLDESGVELAFDEVFVLGDSAVEIDVGLDALDDELVESAP